MTAHPLSKAIYDKAKKLGYTKIILRFSGGNDEGYLYIDMELNLAGIDNYEFTKEIEDWAWKVYDYSGAGDGTDYGDTITYDLENGNVSTQEWYHVVKEELEEISDLEIEE
jgi:hypothetical protein